jgi:hypothetical protein
MAKSIKEIKAKLLSLKKEINESYSTVPMAPPINDVNVSKKRGLDKDNKPHPPGSPEAAAHDVVELNHNLFEELKNLSDKDKKIMLEHLRSLKTKKDLRSPKNRKAGNKPDHLS